jgi:tRNA-binding EMAP/Myf-like protein
MLSTREDTNYLAMVVQLEKQEVHPNADKLTMWKVNYRNIITAKDGYEKGDIVVFFPTSSQLNHRVVSQLNMYRKKYGLNLDPNADGYFDDNRKVNAVKLRGVASEGLLIKMRDLLALFGYDIENVDLEKYVGQTFDSIFDIEGGAKSNIQIVNKYVPKGAQKAQVQNAPNSNKKKQFKQKLLDGQFHFHYDTKHLVDNVHMIDEDDIIAITKKLHGTSGVFANLLVNRKLKWYERLLKKWGVKIDDKEYQHVASSRKVMKYLTTDKYIASDYYDTDLWKATLKEIKDVIGPGISVYGEIVGWDGNKPIQKAPTSYHYNEKVGENRLYVYRVTHTDQFGTVREFSWQQVKDWCNENGLMHVPEYYYGKASAIVSAPPFIGNDFHSRLITGLKAIYLERDCEMHPAKDKVPCEGVVVRVEKSAHKGFKLKSLRFVAAEDKSLDTDEVVES